MKNAILFCSILFFISSCSPKIHYLGDSHHPINQEIDVYYAESEVKQEYKVIGRLSNGTQYRYKVDKIKQGMIEKGKEEGGDAIVFVGFTSSNGGDYTSGTDFRSVSAILIKYQ